MSLGESVKFINFNAKLLVSDTQFLVFDIYFIIFLTRISIGAPVTAVKYNTITESTKHLIGRGSLINPSDQLDG